MENLKEQITHILVDNMLGWKATDKVSTREFNRLLKQILELLAQEKTKWAGKIIEEIGRASCRERV